MKFRSKVPLDGSRGVSEVDEFCPRKNLFGSCSVKPKDEATPKRIRRLTLVIVPFSAANEEICVLNTFFREFAGSPAPSDQRFSLGEVADETGIGCSGENLEGMRKALALPNTGKPSEADVTGFPGRGRTRLNCDMGIPAVRGESVSTGSARSREPSQAPPSVSIDSRNGANAVAEPVTVATANQHDSSGPATRGIRVARRFRLDTETRKGSGGSDEGNGCGKARDFHHREAPPNGCRPAARIDSDLRVKR